MSSRSIIAIRTFRYLSLALPLALPLSASAQDAGGYVGFSAGRAFADLDGSGITASLQRGGYRFGQFSSEEEDPTFKVLGGYRFNPNLALEGSYFDLGDYDFDATLLPAATQHVELSGLKGFALDLVGTLNRTSAVPPKVPDLSRAPSVAGMKNMVSACNTRLTKPCQ
jgi:OOP family OmpA-OmpF porin